MELGHPEPHEAQEDVEPVALALRLDEDHHVVQEGPAAPPLSQGQQGMGEEDRVRSATRMASRSPSRAARIRTNS